MTRSSGDSSAGAQAGANQQAGAYLAMDRRHALLADARLPAVAQGTALFADISGFTSLTESLERDLGARRGGEVLTVHLNQVYGALIREIHRFRGSVIGFSGDAITCWFAGDTGARAVTCGLSLQALMASFQSITTPSGARFSFSLKVAITGGQARRMAVGDPDIQILDVLSGALVERLAVAEQRARRGQVVIDDVVCAALGERASVVAAPGESESDDGFALLTDLRAPSPATPWPEADLHALASDVLAQWLLPPVYRRLAGGQGDFLAELRPVVALFLRFSGLAFESDESVRDKLDAYIRWTQGVLQRYEGSLIQLTTGDKGSYLYAAFGAPLAHEDDTARAIAAARILRAPPAELDCITGVQIGMSRGRMRTGGYGSGARRTYGALGDETNVAARLMTRARPGEVLVSARIARSPAAGDRCQPLGEVMLKGKRQPLAVYALDRGGPPKHAVARTETGERRRRKRTPIVGRNEQCQRLDAALTDVCGRRRTTAARALILEGEAGIGKSRLVEYTLDRARVKARTEASLGVYIARTDALEHATAYFAWRRVFAQLFGVAELRDPADIRARISAHLPAPLRPLAPLSSALIDVEWGDVGAGDPRLRGALRAVSLPIWLTAVFRALATPPCGDGGTDGERPALLIIEDMHWLDSSSWALLENIRRQSGSLLIVATTRPLLVPPVHFQTMVRSPQTTRIRLEAMPRAEERALVARRLGVADVPDEVAALIHDKAEGNPFFGEELVRALSDSGLVRVENGTCIAEPELDALDFPDNIEGLVTSRIDSLEPTEQLALKVASVIGRVFPLNLLADVLPTAQSRAELTEKLAVLAALDLTLLESARPEPHYIFKHAITRDVAYNLMLFEQRRLLHSAIADWYEGTGADDSGARSALLAHHRENAILGLSEPPTDAVHAAARALLQAGKRALESGATPEAIDQLERALKWAQMLPESDAQSAVELDIVSTLGAALAIVRGPAHEEVARMFDRALILGRQRGDIALLFEGVFGSWYAHFIGADRDGAMTLSEQLIALASEAHGRSFHARAQEARGSTLITAGRYPEGRAHMTAAIESTQREDRLRSAMTSARDPLVIAHDYRAWAHWFLGYPDRSRADVATAIELAKEVAHPLAMAQALSFGAQVHRYCRALDTVEEMGRRALAISVESSIPMWIAGNRAVLGWALLERGQLDTAARALEECLDMASGLALGIISMVARSDLIRAYIDLGRFDEAQVLIDRAKEIMNVYLTRFCEPEIYRLEGELWRARGDGVRAEQCLQGALSMARADHMRSLELRVAMSLSRLYEERRQGEIGRALIAACYEQFTEGFDTGDLREARAQLGIESLAR